MQNALTRSHLSDGRAVGWFGKAGVVIDAELASQQVPPALAARYGSDDFWGRWTRAECAAKLADVPITVWLRRHGLSTELTLQARTERLGDVIVTVAWRL